jgi:peptide/nickel transport system permease protein
MTVGQPAGGLDSPDLDRVTTVEPIVTTVVPAAPGLPAPRPMGRLREILYFAVRTKKVLIGVGIIGVFVILAFIGPLIRPGDPDALIGPLNAPPSAEWWFGTTSFGQDVFAQFVYALGSTFVVGLLGGGIAAVIGMTVGFVAGYRGGVIDEILNMLTNVVLVIPTLALLLIAVAYLSARGIVVEALFIGLTSWPWAARAIRAQTFSLRSRDFVQLARMSGVRNLRIVFTEIAPNMSSYLFLTFILLFGGAILIAATLDFIGLGPTSGSTLGLMMYESVAWSALQLGLWWWFVPPGVAITAIVGALYITNVGLDEVFNPRLRNT